MYIKSETSIKRVLKKANNIEGKKVILASDWTTSAFGSRLERQVICHWKDRQYQPYVTWTQFVEFPDEYNGNNYNVYMTNGGYYETVEEAKKCFEASCELYLKHLYKNYNHVVELNI